MVTIPLMCMTALLANGCLTPAFLDTVNPSEKVIISHHDTTEEELQRRNLLYTKRDNYFVVEKTPWQKAGDYTVLGIGLPFTAAADAVLAACCVILILEAPAHRHDDDYWFHLRPRHHKHR